MRDALERWYRRRARVRWRRASTPPARARAPRYTTLQIRGQRTRWASLLVDGAMSFNWRLLLAPPEMLDYVVEHEVVHLEVLDHSQRFWIAAGRAGARTGASTSAGCARHGHALQL